MPISPRPRSSGTTRLAASASSDFVTTTACLSAPSTTCQRRTMRIPSPSLPTSTGSWSQLRRSGSHAPAAPGANANRDRAASRHRRARGAGRAATSVFLFMLFAITQANFYSQYGSIRSKNCTLLRPKEKQIQKHLSTAFCHFFENGTIYGSFLQDSPRRRAAKYAAAGARIFQGRRLTRWRKLRGEVANPDGQIPKSCV